MQLFLKLTLSQVLFEEVRTVSTGYCYEHLQAIVMNTYCSEQLVLHNYSDCGLQGVEEQF